MAHFDPDGQAPADSGIYGLPTDEAEARVVLVPVPFEATVSYGGGAANGPELILEASKQVDLFDLETGRPYQAGIVMRPIPAAIVELNKRAKADAQVIITDSSGTGDHREELERVRAAGEAVNKYVESSVREIIAAGKIAGVVGGDHSVPFGSIKAHAEHYGDLGVLHLDAHADLRRAYEGFEWSHASIMECVVRQIPQVTRIVQIGIRDVGARELELIEASHGRVQTYVDPLIARARMQGTLYPLFKEAVAALPANVYLSFDVDGLDPRLCPSTGTPVPGGLDLLEISVLLELVVESGRRIVGLDLVEVAGELDGSNEWDGNVGARLLYKMIGWTLRSQAIVEHDQDALWSRLRGRR